MMEGDAPTRAKWQTVLRQMGSYRPDWALHLGDPYALAPARINWLDRQPDNSLRWVLALSIVPSNPNLVQLSPSSQRM